VAQRYFDQGVRLVFAFNHDEAIRAFREAVRRDPGCAMAHWGVAWALGPNYNLALDPERERAARAAIGRAQALAPHASRREQAYIRALAVRYAPARGRERRALDEDYADAMWTVSRRDPDDLDAAVLYAEALMLLHPWDLWSLDGQPRPGTIDIVATLEAVLARDPDHPGANHYYIHTVEASPHPERALASAGRLPGLMPAAGHLVHMPSHVYMRVGRYADAAEANRRAVAVDRAYIAREQPAGVYPMMYYPHNLHFLWAAASMEGRSAEAIAAARQVVATLDPDMMRAMPMVEYFAPTAVFALARFGRWDDLLVEPLPADEFAFAAGMAHYTRGLALSARGRSDDATTEQTRVAAAAAAMPADRIVGDNQPAAAHLRLAATVLAGEIAARQGDRATAIATLEEAVRMEDALPYTEPPAWYQPVRHLLGAELLAAERPAEAEAVYRQDLAHNPDNGWALDGLARSLRARGQDAAAADIDHRFQTAWANDDVRLTGSRF
jgi:tetratricopeptide (TPR) repeat protein